MSAKAAPSSKPKVSPRQGDSSGPNPTIASYIQQNNIQERPVKMGDPGSPTIDMPVPDGWEPAGGDTPDWAYGAIVYTGPEGVLTGTARLTLEARERAAARAQQQEVATRRRELDRKRHRAVLAPDLQCDRDRRHGYL